VGERLGWEGGGTMRWLGGWRGTGRGGDTHIVGCVGLIMGSIGEEYRIDQVASDPGLMCAL